MNTERWPGRIALMVAHCAGMVDLIALPVWVGTLIVHYELDPQQAGGLATLFLVGAVVSSIFFAPRFNRFRGRVAATAGFAIAGGAFIGVTFVNSYASMAALHLLAGLAAGCALSFTHGTIGRSLHPHRLFAFVGVALGIFAIVFLGATPKIISVTSGVTLFWVFGGVMLFAALVCALAFPAVSRRESGSESTPAAGLPGRLPPAVWFAIVGISCMTVVQAMTFSFLERMGMDRGFGLDAVTGVLIAMGIVNLVPAVLAVILEHRISARKVVVFGPVAQAALALLITQSSIFAPYAAGAVVFTGVLIFTHTFAFGLLSRLDPSGRAVAATPAMLMIGSAIGPILGGTLVKFSGYESLGLAAVAIGGVSFFCFMNINRASAAKVSALGVER